MSINRSLPDCLSDDSVAGVVSSKLYRLPVASSVFPPGLTRRIDPMENHRPQQ
jgi:hypothetical protein